MIDQDYNTTRLSIARTPHFLSLALTPHFLRFGSILHYCMVGAGRLSRLSGGSSSPPSLSSSNNPVEFIIRRCLDKDPRTRILFSNLQKHIHQHLSWYNGIELSSLVFHRSVGFWNCHFRSLRTFLMGSFSTMRMKIKKLWFYTASSRLSYVFTNAPLLRKSQPNEYLARIFLLVVVWMTDGSALHSYKELTVDWFYTICVVLFYRFNLFYSNKVVWFPSPLWFHLSTRC